MPEFLPIINVPSTDNTKGYWSLSDFESNSLAPSRFGDIEPNDACTMKATATRYSDLKQENFSMKRPTHHRPCNFSPNSIGHMNRLDKSAPNNDCGLTIITGVSGHRFALVNGKTVASHGFAPGKKIVAYGGSCKVRNAVQLGAPMADAIMAVKKVSTGYGRIKNRQAEDPQWSRITKHAVYHTAKSLSLTPNDKHFLQAVDYAIFEERHNPHNEHEPATLKLYAFFPKCQEDLGSRIMTGDLTLKEKQYFATRCIDTLQALRKYGLVHLDIKPDNYLITADGELRLTDFVFARKINTVNDNTTRYSAQSGTPRYMPSKLNDGEWSRPLSAKKMMQRDLLSTAQLFYEMDNQTYFAGLFSAETIQELERELYPYPSARPKVQHTLTDVAKEIMAKILVDGKDISLEEIYNMAYFKQGVHYETPLQNTPPSEENPSPLPLVW